MKDWKQINDIIMQADSIVLTTHENPDGDGIGSIVALYHYLKKHDKQCRIILTSKMPDEYRFLDPENVFEFYSEENHRSWLEKVDVSILLDIGNYTRTGAMWDVIKENGTTIINIDHHPYPNGHPFTINFADVNACATGELIFDFIKALSPELLTKEVYQALYIAIMTDTGSFSYNNTNLISHKIAVESIKAGVDTAKLHQRVYGSSSRSRIQLLAAVAGNLNYEYDGKLAWFKINQELMKITGASNDDVDGFTDFARAIKGVEVALMIYQNEENSCRINFRSKGMYHINKVAQYFGGGGHAFAAGAKVKGTLDDVAPLVVNQTIEIMKQQEEKLG